MRLYWWGTGERVEDRSPLRSPVERFDGSKLIEEASDITVYINGVMVLESHDKQFLRNFLDRGETNDLFISTTYQMGTEPTIDVVHYLKERAELGWYGDFFSPVVLSEEDFKSDHLTLRVKVYDLDSYDQYRATLNALTSVFSAGSVFPELLPYLALGEKISKAILHFANIVDSHDKIIDSRIRFTVAEEKTGQKILQTGHFVCFAERVDAESEGLYLDENLRVVHEDGKEFDSMSYAVYSITDRVYTDYRRTIDQKIAKLLSELRGKGNSGEAGIHFLRETMNGYTKYKKAKRYLELRAKDSLSENERKLMERLERELREDEVLKNIVF